MPTFHRTAAHLNPQAAVPPCRRRLKRPAYINYFKKSEKHQAIIGTRQRLDHVTQCVSAGQVRRIEGYAAQ